VKCGSTLFPNEPYHKIVTIREDDTFGEAFKRLIENRILSLVVVDNTRRPICGLGMLHIMSWLLKEFKEDDFGPSFYMNITSLLSDSPYDDKAVSITKTKIRTLLKGVSTIHGDVDPIYMIPDDSSLLSAVQLMLDKHSHRLVVCDKNANLKSLITQSRIVGLLAYLEVSQLNATVAELNLTKDVVTIQSTETAYKAFKLMESKRISALAVVNEQGELVGNISVSDIKLIGWNADYWNLLGLPIKDYLTQLMYHQESIFIRSYNFWTLDRPHTVVLKCKQQDKLKSVVKAMSFFQVHRLYIVDDSKKPIGVISMYDVLKSTCNFPTSQTA
jgi:CBS domain-containing protein